MHLIRCLWGKSWILGDLFCFCHDNKLLIWYTAAMNTTNDGSHKISKFISLESAFVWYNCFLNHSAGHPSQWHLCTILWSALAPSHKLMKTCCYRAIVGDLTLSFTFLVIRAINNDTSSSMIFWDSWRWACGLVGLKCHLSSLRFCLSKIPSGVIRLLMIRHHQCVDQSVTDSRGLVEDMLIPDQNGGLIPEEDYLKEPSPH